MRGNNILSAIPPITRGLLITNLVVWLVDVLFRQVGIDFSMILGLRYIYSGFHFWQPFTYMFMHANFSHIFFNMFAVWMFGSLLEQHWGGKRYLIYYMVTGVGAAVVQELVQILQYGNTPIPTVTVGASGAVFGLLLAYAWLFPQSRIFIFPIPIPIRAWIMVLIYAIIEFFAGVSGGDNVAHFAHLGGMLFGLIFILVWKKRGVGGMDSGEGWRFQQWRANMKRKRQNRKQTQNSQYANYHYAEPIHEDEPQRPTRDAARETEINRILDKVKCSGYDSLTEDEKRTLFSR